MTRDAVRPGAPVRADGPRRLARHLRPLDSVYTQTVAPFLPRLDLPGEAVWGRQDHQMTPEHGRRLAADLAGARLTWVDDAGHVVPADRPDVVAEAVLRLVAQARPGARSPQVWPASHARAAVHGGVGRGRAGHAGAAAVRPVVGRLPGRVVTGRIRSGALSRNCNDG